MRLGRLAPLAVAALSAPAAHAAVPGERVIATAPGIQEAAIAGSGVVWGEFLPECGLRRPCGSRLMRWSRGSTRELLRLSPPRQYPQVPSRGDFHLRALAASANRVAYTQGVTTFDPSRGDMTTIEIASSSGAGAPVQVVYCGRDARRCGKGFADYRGPGLDVDGRRVATTLDPRGREGVYVRDYARRARPARRFIRAHASAPIEHDVRLAGRYAAVALAGPRFRVRVYDWRRKRLLHTFDGGPRGPGYGTFDLRSDGTLVAAWRRGDRGVVAVVSRSGRTRWRRRGGPPERIWIAGSRIAYAGARGFQTLFVVRPVRGGRARTLRLSGRAELLDFDGHCLLWRDEQYGFGFAHKRLLTGRATARPRRGSPCR